MSPAIIWIAVGIVCIIIEIFTPGFFFFSIGIGAIITGLLSKLITQFPLQILIFAIVTFLIFISTRKWSKKLLKGSDEPTNIEALKGKTATVLQTIPADGRGYVKVGGEEWSAISRDGKKIEKSQKVLIEKIDGNKLIVSLSPQAKKDELEEK